MGFFGDIGKGIAGAGNSIGAGIAASGANAILGIGGKLLGGLFGGEPSEEEMLRKQFEWQKEIMGLQANYNKQQAKYSSELAKEMWDYTNYENQVKHLKAAGLNAALLYGKGGGGGASASGAGQAAGVGVATPPQMMLGLQIKQMESQIKLTNAEAAKTMVEAGKISGVDTKKTESETNLNEINARLADKNIIKSEAETKKLINEAKVAFEIARKTAVEANVSEATQQEQITLIEKGVEEIDARITELKTKSDLNEAMAAWYRKKTDTIIEELNIAWSNANSNSTEAMAALNRAQSMAKHVENQKEYWDKSIENEEERIMQEWIFGGINAIINVAGVVGDFIKIYKKLPENIKNEVTQMIKRRLKDGRIETTIEKTVQGGGK